MDATQVDISEFETYKDLFKEGGAERPLLDQQSTDLKLKMYGLGRQGTSGDNTESKPGMFALVEKKKWEAWTELKGMSQDEAKRQFIVLAKQILATKK